MQENPIAHGLASQMLAGLMTLKDCIERCPESDWNERHNDYPFSLVVFHALSDCDYSLSEDDSEFQEQTFHRANRKWFGDFGQLDDPYSKRSFERDFLIHYYEHCREKVVSVVEAKPDDELIVPNSDIRKNMTKFERYVNAIRHLQHHAAQLGLRLQYATGKEMDWISRGYEA